ncbi:MAG: MBL fold metallo-hydrolase [Chitinophagaceae bacterium]|nr:MBL fold metallo-hydrolase [Chitinophagaceae bacterium]
MKITVLHTGYFKLDGGAMFGVVPKSIWNKLNPADENNLCTWALRCLLVEDDNRRILIDTGIGDKQDEKFFRHYYMSETKTINQLLSENGYSPDDITDVFLTHLHFDHCGGAITRKVNDLVPAFPNATYWSNEKHWQWATKPNDREKASFLSENILPIQQSGKLKFVKEEQDVRFSSNITVRFAYGHTDAMMLPQINYKERTVVYTADLLPSTGHIPIPYVMAYDMFPLTTINEKRSFLKEAIDNNYILFFEHDPVNECCDLQVTDRGIRSRRTFQIQEL